MDLRGDRAGEKGLMMEIKGCTNINTPVPLCKKGKLLMLVSYQHTERRKEWAGEAGVTDLRVLGGEYIHGVIWGFREVEEGVGVRYDAGGDIQRALYPTAQGRLNMIMDI